MSLKAVSVSEAEDVLAVVVVSNMLASVSAGGLALE